MTTPAIESLISNYKECELTIFGSFVSTKLFINHPNVKNIIIDDSKSSGNRYFNLRRLAKSAGNFDMAFSFRKNFTTTFLLWFVDAKITFKYQRYTKKLRHQVLRYNDFINTSLTLTTQPNDLKIYLDKSNTTKSKKQLLGINPGATYGSAKRWYASEFAQVAIKLSDEYDIVIFGGPNETEIAGEIEEILKKENIKNYKNIAGLTSVEELISGISSLDLFVTNDSGPMHLAAAFKVPTVCIFGPTKDKETSQWNNPLSMLIKKDFDCMPCMKRECPLTGELNHQCMKAIAASDVLDKIYVNIQAPHIKKKQLKKEFLTKNNLDKGTQLILFTANNFKQNGIFEFLDIISDISVDNFKAVIAGSDSQLNIAKQKIDELKIETKVILVNDFAIKTCDIFILPTKNKKFALNLLKAMNSKCVAFAPKQNEATQRLLDVFATMQDIDDNIANKIDALLNNIGFLTTVQLENKKIAKDFISTQ